MKKGNDVSEQCSFCGSARVEEDEDIIKCLDCGMGKYKKDRHRQVK
jgi:hypothetical protein